ncbi:MAG: hypothetical protein STSR0009_18300 [Methanoregula sp.]
MPTTQTRIHQKVDEEEIALVLLCKDSHEFYERYVQAFPKKRKGLESISKIWRRRSEFAKKQQLALQQETAPQQGATQPVSPLPDVPVSKPGPATLPDLEIYLTVQNKHLTELCMLAREQLKVSRAILAQLKNVPEESDVPAPKQVVTGIFAHVEPPKKETPKKKIPEKPSPILIGS